MQKQHSLTPLLWALSMGPGQEPSGREIIVDLFCGGGGASTGIEAAIHSNVDVAINHKPSAIRCHRENHPYTEHLQEDVFAEHPLNVTRGRPVGLLWLSPDCTHFSKSKGAAPKDKGIRSLASVGLWYARECRPRMIMLENVEEFTGWCRLDKSRGSYVRRDNGRRVRQGGQPDKRKKGEYFHKFVRRLEQFGYRVEWKVIRACDAGSPTKRKRLFIMARCDGEPIVWPEMPYAPPEVAVKTGKKPYHTAAECIDFTIPTVSIFATQEECREAGINARRPLAEKTMQRLGSGVGKFVLDNPEPFLVQIANYSASNGEYPLTDPLGTQTTRNRFALVMPWLQKYYGGVVGSKVDDPMGTVTVIDHHALVACAIERMNGRSSGENITESLSCITAQVNKHALMACSLEYMHGTSKGESLTNPVPGISAQGQHLAVVESNLSPFMIGIDHQSSPSAEYPVTDQVGTITTKNRFALASCDLKPADTMLLQGDRRHAVYAFLMKYYGTAVGQPLASPLDTITSQDRFCLVTVHGLPYVITDIGIRMLQPKELLKAQFGKFAGGYSLKGLNKTESVDMIGNSVCPEVVELLVKANFERLCWGGNGTVSRAA